MIKNNFYRVGNRQIWKYTGGCSYKGVPDDCHGGKTEFHHPCSEHTSVGLDLCEDHHSLLKGRKKRLPYEVIINKTLTEMHQELKELELQTVLKAGLLENDIDKG